MLLHAVTTLNTSMYSGRPVVSVAYCVSMIQSSFSLSLQLFRRVAAALPGMESMQETSKEGSIL